MLDPEIMRTIRARVKGEDGLHKDIVCDGSIRCDAWVEGGKLIEFTLRWPGGEVEKFRLENKRWRRRRGLRWR